MGVYIKGMKMPKKCLWCPLQYIGFCQVTKTDVNSDLGRRADDCPIVEVPEPHGRLIDENNVIDAIHERLQTLQTHKEFIKKHGDIDLLGVLPYISKIHTVIEAEGE